MGDVREFVEYHDITAEAEFTGYGQEGWSPDVRNWRVQLKRPVPKSEARRGFKTMTVEFHTGSGIKGFGDDPDETAADVMGSLQMDAQTAENVGSAEELANEYGMDWYEEDERRNAKRIFKGVNQEKARLERFLDDELYEELLWETEGL